jgi:amidophosphoribosyltransferase
MCGIFGVTNNSDASRLCYLGLFALQHRGQESAGIVSLNEGALQVEKGRGLVSEVFSEKNFSALQGKQAIGHVRYSTAGGALDANIQPLYARVAGETIALAHNGNIVNADSLRQTLEQSGAIFQGTADTEILLHLLARSRKNQFVDRLVDALIPLEGAVTLVVLTKTEMHAYVDPCGYRPLVIGKLRGEGEEFSWIFASETSALDLVGADFVRDVNPGELVSVDLVSQRLRSTALPMQSHQSNTGEESRCVFEHIYFARPDSTLWGQNASLVRQELGQELARCHPAPADLVIAIPDSGTPLAMGYSQASGIPFATGLIRNHYVGRTFIEPTQTVRNFRVRLKLNPVKEIVRGKRLVVVDDSIVRGTTSRKIIELLREAGAAQVHMRIGSPPVKFPCFYGIDTPKRKELIAQKMSLVEMCDALHADSLGFLPQEALVRVVEKHGFNGTRNQGKKGFCMSCFDGTYQDSGAQILGNPEGVPT